MRNFQTLDKVVIDSEAQILYLSKETDTGSPRIAFRREGGYLSISASYGPMEIAMRPRFAEFTRTLSRLRPIQGLQTTRQVGTGQAYIAFGLHEDGALVMRPTIVADATGLIAFNLFLTNEVRQALFNWLPVE